jgi:hypothetical protein
MRASAGVVLLDLGTQLTRAEIYALANWRMEGAKFADTMIVCDGEENDDERERRKTHGPRRAPAPANGQEP